MEELIKGALNIKTFIEILSYPCEFFSCSNLIRVSISWVDESSNFIFGNESLDIAVHNTINCFVSIIRVC
jgi:hypothetical protein